MCNNRSKNIIEMKALKQRHESENKMWWEMQKFKAELYLNSSKMKNLDLKNLTKEEAKIKTDENKFDVTSLKGKMHPMSAEDIDKQIGDLRDEWEVNINKYTMENKDYDIKIDWFSEKEEEFVKDIYQKRDALLLNRLKELGLLDELRLEGKRRFKRFMVEMHGNTRSVYYDDGSIDGLLVIEYGVSFVVDEILKYK